MLSEYEARKLQDDMKKELNAGPGSVLKYAVFMLLIIGLAWIGTPGYDAAGRDASSPAPQASAEAVRYSRTAFEERRQHHIEAYPDSQVARETAVQRQIQKQKMLNSERRYSALERD